MPQMQGRAGIPAPGKKAVMLELQAGLQYQGRYSDHADRRGGTAHWKQKITCPIVGDAIKQ